MRQAVMLSFGRAFAKTADYAKFKKAFNAFMAVKKETTVPVAGH